MIALELPKAPPSLNAWQRMHWAKRRQVAVSLEGFVALECGERLKMPMVWYVSPTRRRLQGRLRKSGMPDGHRFVRITRRGPRTLDHDNLVGGCKPLVDALVKVGLIENDTPDLVTVEYQQERGTGCRVEVWASSEVAVSGGVCHA